MRDSFYSFLFQGWTLEIPALQEKICGWRRSRKASSTLDRDRLAKAYSSDIV